MQKSAFDRLKDTANLGVIKLMHDLKLLTHYLIYPSKLNSDIFITLD